MSTPWTGDVSLPDSVSDAAKVLGQAISQVQAPGVAADSVAQVFQKGYLLNGRLLRPALVVVAS